MMMMKAAPKEAALDRKRAADDRHEEAGTAVDAAFPGSRLR
jgi:hypothetical protein